MKKPVNQEASETRRRNIALGAALGMILGGAVDLLLGDSGWGFVIGILIGAIIGYRVDFQLPLMQYPAYIVRRITISAGVFLIFLLASQWLLGQNLDPQLQFLVAIAPSIPGALLAISIGTAISKLDEFQRRIQLEAMAIAFGGAVIISLTYALLVEAGIPQVDWVYVPLMLVSLWLIGKLWTIWKYR